jgi:hypothetical protein
MIPLRRENPGDLTGAVATFRLRRLNPEYRKKSRF